MSNKIGVELKIDVTKIDKSRIYNGQKGKYLAMTVFIDPDNAGQYGDHGMITHAKIEGEQKTPEHLPILGNAKVFWRDSGAQNSNQAPQQQKTPYQQGVQAAQPQKTYESAPAMDDFENSDIPF